MATKIVISFAMRNKGNSFAQALRNVLMKQYQLFRQEEVYVDFQITRTNQEHR